MTTIGIKGIRINDINDDLFANLKRNALLYDKIGSPSLSVTIDIMKILSETIDHPLENYANELQFLINEKILVSTPNINPKPVEGDFGFELKDDPEFMMLTQPFLGEGKTALDRTETEDIISWDAYARITCLGINRRNFRLSMKPDSKDENELAIPIVSQLDMPKSLPVNHDIVYSLVLYNIPEPNSETSWDNIIKFRNDPRSVRSLRELRNWVGNYSKSGISVQDAHKQIRDLVAEYTESMRRNKIDFSLTTLENIFIAVSNPENWSVSGMVRSAGKLIFGTGRSLGQFTEEEKRAAKGLSYLHRVKKKFGAGTEK